MLNALTEYLVGMGHDLGLVLNISFITIVTAAQRALPDLAQLLSAGLLVVQPRSSFQSKVCFLP